MTISRSIAEAPNCSYARALDTLLVVMVLEAAVAEVAHTFAFEAGNAAKHGKAQIYERNKRGHHVANVLGLAAVALSDLGDWSANQARPAKADVRADVGHCTEVG